MNKHLSILSALVLFSAAAPAAALAQDVTGSIGGAVSGAVGGLGIDASTNANADVGVDADTRHKRDRDHGSRHLNLKSRTDVNADGSVEIRRKDDAARLRAELKAQNELTGAAHD